MSYRYCQTVAAEARKMSQEGNILTKLSDRPISNYLPPLDGGIQKNTKGGPTTTKMTKNASPFSLQNLDMIS